MKILSLNHRQKYICPLETKEINNKKQQQLLTYKTIIRITCTVLAVRFAKIKLKIVIKTPKISNKAQVPIFVMPLIKLNNVLRLTALAGLFVTTIFYLTKKVIAVYGIAVLINIVTIILLLVAEGKIGDALDGKSD